MSRFLKHRITVVVLLVSILILVIGISAVRGADSPQAASAADNAAAGSPTIVVDPVKTVVEDCAGEAAFSVYGSGWNSSEVVVISVTLGDGGLRYVGAGFPSAAGTFSDDVALTVSECAVIGVKGGSSEGRVAHAPVSIVAEK